MRFTSCINAISAATFSATVVIPGEPEEPVKAIHFFDPATLFCMAVVLSGLRKAESTNAVISSRLTRVSVEISRQAIFSERICEISKAVRPNNSSTITMTR